MSRRLLLVDDADDIRAIARMSLERVGDWTVVSAACGEDALRAFAHEGPFDAILLDVMMPGMDGVATLEGLRRLGLRQRVPVVFLTARVQASERRRLTSLGAAGVIAKPFDPLALPRQLDQLMQGRYAA